MVEPDYGLVNELLSRGVITDRDHAMIQAGRDVYTRNDSLLHCLASTELTGDQFQQLIDALDDTGQAHVANFIRGDGGLLFRDCNPGIPAAFWILKSRDWAITNPGNSCLKNMLKII